MNNVWDKKLPGSDTKVEKEIQLYKSGSEEWTFDIHGDETQWIPVDRKDLTALHKAIGEELGL